MFRVWGYQQISGTGGQLDFVMGAYHSKGGQSFICTPSTRTLKDGTKESLIAPVLTPGSIVTTPKRYPHDRYGIRRCQSERKIHFGSVQNF